MVEKLLADLKGASTVELTALNKIQTVSKNVISIFSLKAYQDINFYEPIEINLNVIENQIQKLCLKFRSYSLLVFQILNHPNVKKAKLIEFADTIFIDWNQVTPSFIKRYEYIQGQLIDRLQIWKGIQVDVVIKQVQNE